MPGHEGGPLVGQYLGGDADATEQEELVGDGLGGGLSKGHCFRVSGGIVNDDQDVFVAPGGLRQWPHPDTLEGNLDDGQRNQRAEGRCPRRRFLAGWAGLTKALDFSLPSWPVEAVTDTLGGVGCSKVAGKRVRVGQLQHRLSLRLWHHQ